MLEVSEIVFHSKRENPAFEGAASVCSLHRGKAAAGKALRMPPCGED